MLRSLKIAACGIGATLLAAGVAFSDEVVIGAALPLTGNTATWAGGPVKNGMELAADEVNARKEAGDHSIALLIEDMASDRTQGITLSSRFINSDNVSMVLGLPTSIYATAVAPMANEAETPMLAVAVSKAVTAAGPWSFKLWQGSDVPSNAVADLIVNKLKPKTALIVYNRDNDAYVEISRIVKTRLAKAGVEILADEGTLITDTNFTALATKIADLKPDILYVSGVAESMANVVVQARQAGMPDTVQIVGAPGVAPPAYQRLGGAAIEGTIFTGNYFINAPQKVNQEFVAAYKARYNQQPDEFAAAGYTLVKVAANAIRSAGGDRTKLRDALAATSNLPVVIGNGSLTFQQGSREPAYGTLLLQWKNGTVSLYGDQSN